MSTSPKIPPQDQVLNEVQTSRTDQGLLYLSAQFQKRREALEASIQELQDHLSKLLCETKVTVTLEQVKQKQNLGVLLSKAKEYFKEYATGMIMKVKSIFEESQIYDILPLVFRNELVEITKQNLSLSYNIIIEKFVQTSADQIENNVVSSQDENLENLEDKNITNIKKSKRKGKSKIPKRAITILKNWLTEHQHDPYPSHAEKSKLATEAGITPKQVQNWFINARGRTWRKTFNPEQFVNQIEEKLKDKPQVPIAVNQPQEQVIPQQAQIPNTINMMNNNSIIQPYNTTTYILFTR